MCKNERKQEIHDAFRQSWKGRSKKKSCLNDHQKAEYILSKTDGGRSYGEIIHNGVSHAWTIVPRDKQALRWSAGGDFVFFKNDA